MGQGVGKHGKNSICNSEGTALFSCDDTYHHVTYFKRGILCSFLLSPSELQL